MTRFGIVMMGFVGLAIAPGCLAGPPVDASAARSEEPASVAPEIAAQIARAAADAAYHQLKNLAYGQCADAPKGALNVVLDLTGCNSSSQTQKWAFVPAGDPNTFYIVNQASGFCAEVNHGSSIDGELVDEWHCNGSSAEQWVQSFRVVDGVVYQQFRHAGTGLCLDTVGGRNSQLMQWDCGSDNDAQTWLVQ